MTLNLVSHALCPDVQRVAITMADNGMAPGRTTIDVTAGSGGFRALPPLPGHRSRAETAGCRP